MSLFLACLTTAGTSDARFGPLEIEGSIVGVAPDGTFVYRSRRTGGDRDDGTTFDVVSAEGEHVAALRCRGDDCSGENLEVVSRDAWLGRSLRGLVGEALLGDQRKSDGFARALRRLLSLWPVSRSPEPIRVERWPGGDTCAHVSLGTRSGGLPVYEIGPAAAMCHFVLAELFEHPQSTFYFIGFRLDSQRDRIAGLRVQDFRWFPKRRAEALRKFRQGEAAYHAERYAEAIELLHDSMRLAPDFGTSRSLLMRALAASGAGWQEASRALERPETLRVYEPWLECFGGSKSDADLWLSSRSPWMEQIEQDRFLERNSPVGTDPDMCMFSWDDARLPFTGPRLPRHARDDDRGERTTQPRTATPAEAEVSDDFPRAWWTSEKMALAGMLALLHGVAMVVYLRRRRRRPYGS